MIVNAPRRSRSAAARRRRAAAGRQHRDRTDDHREPHGVEHQNRRIGQQRRRRRHPHAEIAVLQLLEELFHSLSFTYAKNPAKTRNPKTQRSRQAVGILEVGIRDSEFRLSALVRDHVLRVPLLARQILGEGRLRVRVQPQRASFNVIRLAAGRRDPPPSPPTAACCRCA